MNAYSLLNEYSDLETVVNARNTILNVHRYISETVFDVNTAAILCTYLKKLLDARSNIGLILGQRPAWFANDDVGTFRMYTEYVISCLSVSPTPERIFIRDFRSWLSLKGLDSQKIKPWKVIRDLKVAEKSKTRLPDSPLGSADPDVCLARVNQLNSLCRQHPDLPVEYCSDYFQLIQSSGPEARAAVCMSRYESHVSSFFRDLWVMVAFPQPWTRRFHNHAYQIGSLIRLVRPSFVENRSPLLALYPNFTNLKFSPPLNVAGPAPAVCSNDTHPRLADYHTPRVVTDSFSGGIALIPALANLPEQC